MVRVLRESQYISVILNQMRRTLLFSIALLVNVLSFAQSIETDSNSRDFLRTLSKNDFDKMIDSCTPLINSKKYDQISDHQHRPNLVGQHHRFFHITKQRA
jgi:hypothetical protein